MWKSIFCLLSALPFCLEAFDDGWDYEIGITGGYRNDKIETRIDAYDPPENFLLSDNLFAKNISVFEVGAIAKMSLCNSWLIRGYADYGWITNGNYKEISEATGFSDNLSKGKIDKGHTHDYSIGLGYLLPLDPYLRCLFPCFPHFSIGPIGGYSFHTQKIIMEKIFTEGIEDPILSNLEYRMRWNSPWAGADIVIDTNCFKLHFGYEYHWCHWHAKWLLDGPDVIGGAYSDKREATHGHANVFFIDSTYAFSPCGEFFLSFKYQHWNANDGIEVPLAGSFSAVGLNNSEVDKVPKALWESYEVKVGLAWTF